MAKPEVNPHASSLGKLGGKARAKALTPERRKEIAVHAIQTRWKNHTKKRQPAKE